MPLKSILLASAIIAAGAAAQAATLVGNGTYAVADDLTLINDGGSTFEFLDLSFTKTQSVASALSTYGGDGFAVADENQITALLDAFGIVYKFIADGDSFTNLGVAFPVAASFTASLSISYFSNASFGNASLGTYANASGTGTYSFLCISEGDCSSGSFTRDYDLSSGNSLVGIFLVREGASISAVPLPAAAPLLAMGVAALALLRRRRRA
jgi:hypothetical protein